MDNKNSILTRMMQYITKHSTFVLILVILLTVFFGYQMRNISLSTDIYAFMASAPDSEYITSPDSKPNTPLKLQDIKNATYEYPERGTVITGKADIPPEAPIATPKNTVPGPHPTVFENPTEKTADKSGGGFYDGYVIIFSSDKMFDAETLNVIYDVKAELEKQWEIGPCLSPFDYITIEKVGSRLSIVPIAPVKSGEEWSDYDVELFKYRLMKDSVAKNYLYTEDGNTIMIYYRARGINENSLAKLDKIVDPLRNYGRVALNGGGMINARVMHYLNKDLFVLLSLCFIIILIVFYLSFRSVRSMLIPASLSIIGIIWTLGTMAMKGYQLTIVTILTPCLVLTLGSSYSLHMINEYFSCIASENKDKIASSYAKIIKTIFFAMATTVSGFLSLLICRTPIFKEFGITITIGVIYCAILAFTYLPAVLAKVRHPKTKQIKNIQHGVLARIITWLSNNVIKYWYVLLVILLILTCVFFVIKDDIGFDSNYMSYFPEDDPLIQDSLFFARTLGGTDPYYLTIKAPGNEKGFFLKSKNLSQIYAYEHAITEACPDIVQILSFSQYVSFLNEVYNGETGIPENNGLINLLSRTLMQVKSQIGTDVLDMLISPDGSEITLSMRNFDSVEQDLQTTKSARRLETTLDYYRYLLPEGTTSKIWCGASTGLRASEMIMEDQTKATALSLLLIFIFSSIAFLSLPYGITALIPVSVGVMFNYLFMWAAGIPFDIVTVGFSSITIGAGVDDAIHYILRYRMQRKEHPEYSVAEANRLNILQTGRPIILTTVAVDAGLIMLTFASYTPIRYFGILMCIALTAAMIATLMILPPVLIAIDKVWTALIKCFRKK